MSTSPVLAQAEKLRPGPVVAGSWDLGCGFGVGVLSGYRPPAYASVTGGLFQRPLSPHHCALITLLFRNSLLPLLLLH